MPRTRLRRLLWLWVWRLSDHVKGHLVGHALQLGDTERLQWLLRLAVLLRNVDLQLPRRQVGRDSTPRHEAALAIGARHQDLAAYWAVGERDALGRGLPRLPIEVLPQRHAGSMHR